MWYTNYAIVALIMVRTWAHDVKDFDDAVLYKIDFEAPDFEKDPDLMNHLQTFYTHEKEKYDCVIPELDESKEELVSDEPEQSPLALLQPIFTAPSCSFRIEAYWSYEICHGRHVRQYHEEREGKVTKFQEYYLGHWHEDKTDKIQKSWEEDRKAGKKYKTTKIENTKYPYFEMEMSDGTVCDIINAPRTTTVRYICYPHGKNEIYSFKETSSCNYEAIILTSVLCLISAFHPQETKEVSIKCFNFPARPHKPLSMLRQELNDLQLTDADIPLAQRASMMTAANSFMSLDKSYEFVDQVVVELMTSNGNSAVSGVGSDVSTYTPQAEPEVPISKTESAMTARALELAPVKDFVSGKNCLIGGTGWWRYEFCYGRFVRQFHKDKNGMLELYLGYFSNEAHRHWLNLNPEKRPKRGDSSVALWHHYEKGTTCDRTDQPREVDVKLSCMPVSASPSTVSMYLLEPKTCKYTLVVESPIICILMMLTDDYGLADEHNLEELLAHEEMAHGNKDEVKNQRNSGKANSDREMNGIASNGNAQRMAHQSSAEISLDDEART